MILPIETMNSLRKKTKISVYTWDFRHNLRIIWDFRSIFGGSGLLCFSLCKMHYFPFLFLRLFCRMYCNSALLVPRNILLTYLHFPCKSQFAVKLRIAFYMFTPTLLCNFQNFTVCPLKNPEFVVCGLIRDWFKLQKRYIV